MGRARNAPSVRMNDLQLMEKEIRNQIGISFPNLNEAARLELMAIWFQQTALRMRFGLIARAANMKGLDQVERETREGEKRFVAMVTIQPRRASNDCNH